MIPFQCQNCGLTTQLKPEHFPVICCGVSYDMAGVQTPTVNALAPRTLRLTQGELAELQRTDPTLIGNRLESLFKAIGIPTCGGCEQRRDWLNKAHEFLRASAPAQPRIDAP